MKHTRKQLLKMPSRNYEASKDRLYNHILIVPAGTKHESGFMHIAVIGVWVKNEKELYEICGYPDDISWLVPDCKRNGYKLAQLRTDCYYPQGVLKFWGNGKFKVDFPTSSQDIEFFPNEK